MKIRICPSVTTSLESIAQQCLFDDAAQEVVAVYSFSYYFGVYAQGLKVEGGFLVLKGSQASTSENKKLRSRHKKLRRMLIEDGTLRPKESALEFTVPHLFKNEYEATSVITGNNKCRSQEGIWTDGHAKTPFENTLIGITELEMNDVLQ